ncbi:hypothetical protein OGATHE_000989 [Ogataea polymorpha]|uniref:Uncharacterized protein n=2 Tax=Ogataea polymorpha TaxID=460523 RepID=A0A9P8PUA0_9ASCO|nr:hypothetical protein KL927_001685 [Ogataea polymorpha]KAH3677514.1 hypothetical protein OGATHE_000989 [Ogataea polymorpha]
MGVHGLWEIVGPTARPVRLEAMAKKRLAVDASIWIYQFLKAVRDVQGNQLVNSHIVGFFRRICKLLYFGIRPVFVFDGGAPLLKKQTISKRREKREGSKETAEQVARRLLAKQLQNRAEGNPDASKQPKSKAKTKEVPIDQLQFTQFYEDNNYFDTRDKKQEQELEKRTPKKENENRIFRRQDEYDLPHIESFKVDKNDQRVITDYEYDRLTSDLQDELGGIDLDTIDPKSEEFARLPLSTQYIVLSHLRLRSRLRMGYTKQQLETLFPNSMDFSKFQIQMVQKRNFLTQKLMNVAGMDEKEAKSRRIASDRDRIYELQRNENGYTLSIKDDGHSAEKPIDLNSDEERDEDEDDEEWEDVIEPVKMPSPMGTAASEPMFVGEVESSENSEDTTMAMIQSLYEYANNNKKNLQKAAEMSEEEQLRQAVERSKQDYYNMMEQEQQNDAPFDYGAPPPLILTKESLGSNIDKVTESKPVSVPKFDFRSSILTASKTEEPKSVQPQPQPKPKNDKKKPEETPVWFQTRVSKNAYGETGSHEKTQVDKTEDQKAGLFDYADLEPYLEEDESEDYGDAEDHEAFESEVIELDPEPETKPEKTNPVHDTLEGATVIDQPGPNHYSSEATLTEATPTLAGQQVERETKHSENIQQEVSKMPEPLDYVFSDEEEEELEHNLENEEAAYEKFVDQVGTKKPSSSSSFWSMDDEVQLQESMKKQKRDADEVTVRMILDIQDMLSRFGLPYITAPMEAEAQCAELLRLGLVDGIITDDSDCFLFGGDRVYKNMFNEKNFVECYQMEDLERDLGLDRRMLIDLAILLGSDYTEGIKGVGKVAAMEILAEFGTLESFKHWWLDYQNGIIDESKETPVKRKLRKSLKKTDLYLTPEFPDKRVIEAYLHPEVDHDKSEFQWGYPNLDKLRTFLMYNVGWGKEKVDTILLPIIQNMNKPQTSIEEFFPVEMIRRRRDLEMGQRLKNATSKLRNAAKNSAETEEQPSKRRRQQKKHDQDHKLGS